MAARPTSGEDGHTTRLSAFASEEEREEWPDPVDPDALATPPWDDPDELSRLYNEEGLSTARIATEVFRGRVSAETVRKRLHDFGVMDRAVLSPARRLEKMNADDLGGPTRRDDRYQKYTLADQRANNE